MMTGIDMSVEAIDAAQKSADEYVALLLETKEGREIFGHVQTTVRQVSINSFLRGVALGIERCRSEMRDL